MMKNKMEKTILLGLHDKDIYDFCAEICEEEGYLVDSSKTPKNYMEKAQERKYNKYLLDANLGKWGEDITLAEDICDFMIKKGKDINKDLLAISGNAKTLVKLTKGGIPAERKPFSINKLRDFLTQ